MNISQYPERSFSISKLHELEQCQRKYYNNVFGSHNGWLKDAPEVVKELYMFKKLTNMPIIIGNILHAAFKQAIVQNIVGEGISMDKSDLTNMVINRMKETIKDSRLNLKNGNFVKNPSRAIALEEDYFKRRIECEDFSTMCEKASICIENFFISRTYEELANNSQVVIVEVDEDCFREPMQKDNTKLYFKVDLLYKVNALYYVVDWKTGKLSDNDKEQLLVYAYYVVNKYGIDLSQIRARIEYLYSEEVYETQPNIDDYKYIQNKISSGIQEMDSFLQDIELNIPKDKTVFLQTENIGLCHCCKYKMTCEFNKEEILI